MIETRTVSSSEVKDLNTSGLRHGGGQGGENGGGENVAGEGDSFVAVQPDSQEEEAGQELLKATPSTPSAAKLGQERRQAVEATPDSAKEQGRNKGEAFSQAATDSNAGEEATTASAKTSGRGGSVILTGLSRAARKAGKTAGSVKRFVSGLFSNEEAGRDSMAFLPSQANTITPNVSDIIDWTFIVYDHRQEGEIHFNKRDLDLTQEGDYDSYGQSNGDGTLEGAVYGLFAKSDIVHPDGNTGTVYQQNDLVAVAATDRDGNGSFMAYTQRPGSTYNYETGSIEKRTDLPFDGPENLYTDERGIHCPGRGQRTVCGT